jgi:transposase
VDDRKALAGILFVLKTGIPWEDFPCEMGCCGMTLWNRLREMFVEERRRLKIIPNAFGERAVLKLMFGALIRAAERWRSIKVTEFEPARRMTWTGGMPLGLFKGVRMKQRAEC